MKGSNVIYALARLSLILAACLIVPLGFSLYFQDGLCVIFLSLIAGLSVIGFVSRFIKTSPTELSIREGFLIATLCWVSFALIGSFPFILSGAIPDLTDAFFETMSGFTTTGATILPDIEILPESLLVWRNMTQWLGGMGVIALAVAVFPFLGVGGAQLFRAEVPGPTKDKISPRISETAKILWWIYLILTVAEIILLMVGGLTFFQALCVAFGTMATGGFVPLNASIAAFPSPFVQYTVIFFMLLAGTNFSLHYWALKGKPGHYTKNPEFRLYIGIIVGATFLIMLIKSMKGADFSEGLFRGSLFQTVSVMTTTGFITEDYEFWPFATQIVLLFLMFVGGCASSTGGAIKNVRICVLFKFIGNELKRLFHPHGIFPVKLEDKPVPESIVTNIIGFITLYLLFFAGGVLAMTWLGMDIDTAIGSAATTLGNVGPGFGSVGPSENYSHIPTTGKWILSFLMMVGRLEIYTVLVLFTPRFWR